VFKYEQSIFTVDNSTIKRARANSMVTPLY